MSLPRPSDDEPAVEPALVPMGPRPADEGVGGRLDVMVPHRLRELTVTDLKNPPARRILVPIALFAATCLTTFLAGASNWMPTMLWQPGNWLGSLQIVVANWQSGALYMAAVIAILFAHEMGHFLQTVRYRVPATLPFFIPMPIAPTGTMGAVIGMQASSADRKQLFDIGLCGPWAGLVVALPVICWGILTASPQPIEYLASLPGHVGDPLIFDLLIGVLRPDLTDGMALQKNALLWAGWVGMLITGLNMLPVSQLDGGHVTYALFGRRAHGIARAFVVSAICFMLYEDQYTWTVMLVIILFLGVDHPPTHDDQVPLGKARRLIGLVSLLIPVFCFTPRLIP